MAEPILFLDHASGLGGAEKVLLLLLKDLDRTRWRPFLICPGGPLAERAESLGISVSIVSIPRLRRSLRGPVDWLRTALVIADLARRVNAAFLVANTVRAAFYGALAAYWSCIPFIWYMHDFWLSESRPRHLGADYLGKRGLCAAAAHVIANSYATASHLPCPSKVTVVYNGIEVENYDPALDGRPFRRQYGIPEDVPVVGMVGRLRPWKGQDRFLRVLAQVREVIPIVWGLVVGGHPLAVPDDYPQRLRLLTAELGLKGCVVFTDHLEDVRPALAAMDLFVHPGDPEPFGLVNIEAMAMARPVVAFAQGALPEIVVDKVTGLLVPPGDEASMAQAILALLHNPGWQQMLGAAGRERVQMCFASDRMVREVSAIFEKVV
ncbi:MAG: glycosyltransferase family 4 protein [Anaerolineae bacterium]|nr:glycosyltransferase family 4 protein [Anaerolineae bacterium]MDW8068963.1 glycosyltransferase family 4 protein [Anaerolineae bacterium]